MKNRKFIAELHDIGKLVDNAGNKCRFMLSHYFNEEEIKKAGITLPNNKTFEAIQKHHCEEENPYCKNDKDILNNLNLILLIIADHFSSGFSRVAEKIRKTKGLKVESQKGIYKFWHSKKRERLSARLVKCNPKIIGHLLQMVQNNDLSKFWEEFEELTSVVPEDKKQLFNVVSLKTHLILTGKVYRFLLSQVETFRNSKIKFVGDRERTPTGIKDIEKTVQFKIVFASLIMPRFIARVSDLAFFEVLKDELNRIENIDQVLFVSPESFLFICNKEEEVEKVDFVKRLLELGIRLETKEIVDCLSNLGQMPEEIISEKLRKKYEVLQRKMNQQSTSQDEKTSRQKILINTYRKFYNIYEEKKTQSIHNLCDLCQLREAIPYNQLSDKEKELITDSKNEVLIVESLCRKCLDIRKFYKEKSKLKSFANWEKEEPRPDAMWIKISLDMDALIICLEKNYEKYIEATLSSNPELCKNIRNHYELRFTWIAEFLKDYNYFLESFFEIISQDHEDEAKKIYKDFYVIKVHNPQKISDVVEKYFSVFNEIFPDFENFHKTPSIIFTAMWTNVKSPFMEVWREITQKQSKPINIILKNKNRLQLDFEAFDYLINQLNLIEKRISRFLHKLAAIYEESGLKILPMVEIFNERWKYENLYKAISEKELSVEDILNWYRLKQ